MIRDHINNLNNYVSLIPSLRKIIDFVESNNLLILAPGKHEIDGDKIFAMLVETNLKKRNEIKLEAHRKYLDLHLVIKGNETIAWLPTFKGVSSMKFNKEEDYMFFDNQLIEEDSTISWLKLAKDEFIICFPGDAHAPLIGEGKIKKVIFKILIE
jgi:biofilm protein TabA